ncbi:hypothetical protein GJ744_011336 [Endocarpon pusillum]|uniref:F-box domain-containing protein n=1 Tax=Endocarpon pusillum TaxID=364733 RepID=A0A8H7E948_9EURO|nr:hypothetical protein GJ744_011336 [Endocarpon pusillum]
MARLLSNVLSWLHTTATSYDFESIESHHIEDSGITHKSTPRAANPLPNLKWSTPAVMERIKQCPSPILQTTKQHSSPVLHSTKQSSSSLLQIVKQHPSWKTFIKPSTNHVASGVPTSKVETLPNELKLAIMQRLPNLDALHALSLASKSFHEFRSQHNPLIAPFVLRNELGPILFDEAYWVSQASQTNLFQKDYSQQVTSFLNKWLDYEAGSLLPNNVPSNTIVEMSTLYRKITFLVQDFCAWTTEGYAPMHCSQTLRFSLSQNEVLRIARAFYRLELFCILFRHRRIGGLDSEAHEQNDSIRRHAYRLFGFWNAWENEEIACIRDYIFTRLAVVFARIRQAASIRPFKVILYEPGDEIPDEFPSGTVYVDSDRVPDWYREHSACGADLSPEGSNYTRFREMFVMQGLDYLSRLLSSKNPQEQADMFISKWADFTHNPDGWGFLSGELETTPVRLSYESETREAFFHGDEEIFETDEGAEGPNFAWCWAGKQKFQAYYASADRAHLRRWGYVMWDLQRLMGSHAWQNAPNPQDPFGRCEQTIIDAHGQTCWRRSTRTDHNDKGCEISSTVEEAQLSTTTEVDCACVGSNDESSIDENQTQQIEVRVAAPEEDLAKVTTAGSDSGYSSVTTSILPAQDIERLHVPLDNLTKADSEPHLAQAVMSTPLDEAICAAYKDVQEFKPSLPAEATALPESFGTLDTPTDNVSEEKPAMEAAVGPGCVVSAPHTRKMAKAISPRTKMLKLQQQTANNDEIPITDSKEVEEPIIILCTTPESTVIPVRPPSPPASECSTASDDSINFITSPPLSTTSNQRTSFPTGATDGVDGLSPCPVEEDLMVQDDAAEQSNPTEDTDEQPQELYMKDPSEVAAWIEGSDTPHSSSSSSNNSSMASTSATKQQRKKANRKARQRTLELMTKIEQEMLAERVKVQEAKKEHQKMKKERRKLEKEICGGKGKAKGKGQTTQPTKRAKKERKIGYVIG